MIAVLCVLVGVAAAVPAVAAVTGAYLPPPVAGLLALALVFPPTWHAVRWCLWPGRRLPRNRIRAMRNRARLGLRPGPGHATGFECWLRWGRGAVYRRSRQARPSLPAWARY